MTRLRSAYFIVANTAILLWVLQTGACAVLNTYDRVVPPLLKPAMSEAIKANYAHMAPKDLDDLLRTARELRFRYEPVVGFMNEAARSRFVNVDVHGIRANNATPRDLSALQDASWFFGGSTAFGDGVADHETIPAQIERVLGRPVVNLGVRNYSSTEENLLFNRYLRVGYRPAFAIFLDGINETCEPGLYAAEMNILVGRAQNNYIWDVGGPVTYAYSRLSRKILKLRWLAPDDSDRQSLTCARDGVQNALSTIHRRTLAERDALCRLYEIDCRTVVQPFAGTHGRREDFKKIFLEGDGKDLRELFFHLEPGWRAAEAIFVTDALDQYERHAFIDEVHYSADASRVIADTIAKRLNLAGAAPAAP